MRRSRALFALAWLSAFPACGSSPTAIGAGAPGSPLIDERTIALAHVAGRIDHLAVDPAHHRLFVAELGNGSVDAVNLESGAAQRISGLSEPQGLAYLPDRDELVVTSGGNGTVRFYDAGSLTLKATLQLGGDADNVRVDPSTGFVAVGYGSGAIALIDPARRSVVKSIRLPAHPEGFRFDPAGKRVFVNLPNARLVMVTDWDGAEATARWPARHALNFPMALDPATNTIAVVYRWPARLELIDAASGTVRQDLSTCGDADDVFFDEARKRLYVVCGAGVVDVFQQGGMGYANLARVTTRHKARTGLFVPELDRLIVAAPAEANGTPASLIVLRPASSLRAPAKSG